MVEEKQRELRVVVFPWLAHGHITPFVELGKRLTSHGLKVFIVSTPMNIKLRITPLVWDAPGIDLIELPMPSVEGLPTGVECSAELVKRPEGKIGDKGLLMTKWAPQLNILNHASTRAFLTHCGWNSMTEGLRFGLPLITLPMQFEQGLNAKLARELKVGIEVRRNQNDGSFTKDDISEAIRAIMIEEGGAQIKSNAEKTSDMFTSNNFQVNEIDMKNFFSILKTFNK
ncbi:hypothetical protein SUGI_0350550 [Cryptomeria japonica]|nr:hypothetical protein SUGI_0350550 [Cryptomeria japonica]